MNTGRGQIHTAGDVLGIDGTASDWEEPTILDVFSKYGMIIHIDLAYHNSCDLKVITSWLSGRDGCIPDTATNTD